MASGSMASSVSTILQLNDGNFSNWLFRLKCLLEEKQCREVVEKKINLTGLTSEQKQEVEKNDARAKSIIVQCITDRHIEYVRNADSAFEMISSLKNIFERKSTLSRLYVRRKLLTLKCDENEKLQDHFIKFDGLIRDLESTGNQLEEDDKVCHLLLTLSQKYETVITVLETTEAKLTVDFVKSKLLDAELKMNEGNKPREEQCSFVTKEKSKDIKKCFRCGRTGHFIAQCRSKSKSQRQGNFEDRQKFNQKGESRNNNERVNVCRQEENEISFIATTSAAALLGKSENKVSTLKFIIDSGATQHLVCGEIEKHMCDIQKIEPHIIKIANGEKMQALKKGKLKVMFHGIKITINALIVENLCFNLLSVQKINDAGYKVEFEKNQAKIIIREEFILCNFERGLYTVELQLQKHKSDSCMIVKNDNIWHLRLGHLNKRGLELLNLPFSNDVCSSCRQGKATRKPFKLIGEERSRRIGELLHTDIWGPSQTTTMNEERYYLTIIDDFSHFTVVYQLRNKNEADDYIIKYVLELQNRNVKVSRLRSDNGKEFCTSKLRKFCESHGLKQEYTCTYTPQQNSVAERMNRTILDKVRCMFIDTNLPKSLWGEAVRCAVYQINRSPTKALEERRSTIPAEMFGKINDSNRLKIFGSKAWYYKLPRENKLEPRGEEAFMVGYGGPGYRLWDPKLNQIIISRDVVFDESDFKYRENKPDTREIIVETSSYDNVIDQNVQQDEGESTTETRSRRIKVPARYEDFELYMAHCMVSIGEDLPETYEEAMRCQDKENWKIAIKEEIEALQKNETWKMVSLPEGKKPIDSKWVFKIKRPPDGTPSKFKARLCARGFKQKEGIDFKEIFAPTTRYDSIRMLLSLANYKKYKYAQFDIKTAFLYGELDEEVYMIPPLGLYERSTNLV